MICFYMFLVFFKECSSKYFYYFFFLFEKWIFYPKFQVLHNNKKNTFPLGKRSKQRPSSIRVLNSSETKCQAQ